MTRPMRVRGSANSLRRARWAKGWTQAAAAAAIGAPTASYNKWEGQYQPIPERYHSAIRRALGPRALADLAGDNYIGGRDA